jgi:hypothetical protein
MARQKHRVNGHGGAREGAGRPAGVPNATTLKFRQLCRKYDEEAVARLAELMRQDENKRVALAAAVKLLEYGYGKPKDSNMIEQEEIMIEQKEMMRVPYPSFEEIKARAIARGLPVDHLEALMKHEPASKN